jgi:hypothetical protein
MPQINHLTDRAGQSAMEAATPSSPGYNGDAHFCRRTHQALWTVGDIRLPAGALNLRGKHATLNSTFWQDANIFGDLYRIIFSSKYMFLPLLMNN